MYREQKIDHRLSAVQPRRLLIAEGVRERVERPVIYTRPARGRRLRRPGRVFAGSQLRNRSVFIDSVGGIACSALRAQRQPAKSSVTLVSDVSVALRQRVIRYHSERYASAHTRTGGRAGRGRREGKNDARTWIVIVSGTRGGQFDE